LLAPEAHAYTDGASGGSRGPGGYGAVMTWKGKTKEISGEQNTTNLRMELTAACVALEMIDEGHIVTVYSDSSYLVNCMRSGWGYLSRSRLQLELDERTEVGTRVIVPPEQNQLRSSKGTVCGTDPLRGEQDSS
jgi:ribonuclease HI